METKPLPLLKKNSWEILDDYISKKVSVIVYLLRNRYGINTE